MPGQPLYLPAASLETLWLRADVLTHVREYFREREYREVETPLLSHDIVVDAWLDPFLVQTDAENEPRFLQTSPEFGMKRLLAAGAEAIFQITRAFRQGEQGRLHNPEFTMVEWYRVGDTDQEQMTFTEGLVASVAGFARNNLKTPLNHQLPYQRLSYREAFQQVVGEDVLSMTGSELREIAEKQNLNPPTGLSDDDKDGWLNFLLGQCVEPQLGFDQPVFLYDYPASQAALAKVRDGDPPVAERFELYVQGIELCNGYHELTDAAELRKRMQRQNEIRVAAGRQALPLENQLLTAMEQGLPECSGVALGFDRLFMLAIGATSLADVMAFPSDRA